MRRSILAVVVVVAVAFSLGAAAQKLPGSHATSMAAPAGAQNWITPASSVARAEDAGLRAHTNWVFGSVNGKVAMANAAGVGPLTLVQHYETPTSIGHVYKVPGTNGTGIPVFASGTGGVQKGGWGTIAIVDAYDNPYAASEIATFDSFWGIPAASFSQVYANGNGDCTTPPFNAGWGLEESLDIEWAHVLAPKANIVLVEACSNSYTDLLYAEYVAGQIVTSAGGGDISNSWGSGEFSGETSDDLYFGYYFYANTVYFASAGDSGCGAAYPSSSPWLVSAGGTTINRNSTNLAFKSESCWAGSGGGTSSQEVYTTSFSGGNTGPWADYQYPIFGQANRSTPDMSFDADPASGVVVYDCAYASGTCYYYQVGGTSVSSPSLAGLVNNAANKLGTGHVNGTTGSGFYTAEEDNLLYSQLGGAAAYKTNFYDVTTGSNGCSVGKQWDYCTGVGSPRALLGK